MIQVRLGHAKLETTALYTRLAVNTIRVVTSPLDSSASTRRRSRRRPDGRPMERPPLEVADIFRAHGPAFRIANAGHVSLDQLKVMSAIET